MMEDRNEEALCQSLQLREWALAAGRFFQSEQTGYVHIYQGSEGQNSQTIPLFENVLFSYALLRSRLLEQAQEAKGLLKGLLAFQNRQMGRENGNFPVYLHEYPRCKDPSSALQMLAPFYWILKQFGHVLGSEIKELLEAAAAAALEQCSKAHEDTPFPFFLAVRLAASQLAFGKFWGQAAWTARGEELLEQLALRQLDGWQSTRQLADLLVGLQMAFPSIENSPWNCLWKRMEQTWHSQLGAYIGPSLREWQMGVEPQTNLFGLFGGFFSGRFSKGAAHLNPSHLKGILIQPTLDRFKSEFFPSCFEGEFQSQGWRILKTKTWGCTLFDKTRPINPSQEKTHTPFSLAWGDLNRLHSLVCQGGNIEKVLYSQPIPDQMVKVAEQAHPCENDETFILNFDLKEVSANGESSPKREIEFFADFHPGILFRINGMPATTFELGQKIEIIAEDLKLSILFECVEGEGRFFGHLMRGNRPSQLANKEGAHPACMELLSPNTKDLRAKRNSLSPSYDWTIFLRTLRRSPHCKIKATIHVHY